MDLHQPVDLLRGAGRSSARGNRRARGADHLAAHGQVHRHHARQNRTARHDWQSGAWRAAIEAIKRHKAVHLIAVGGAAYLVSQGHPWRPAADVGRDWAVEGATGTRKGIGPRQGIRPRKGIRPRGSLQGLPRAVLQQLRRLQARHQGGHARAPANRGGCFTCHGAGALEHAQKGGGKGVGGVLNPARRRVSASAKNDICLTCHQGGKRVHWSSEHPCEPRRELHVVPPGPHGARPHARQAHPV